MLEKLSKIALSLLFVATLSLASGCGEGDTPPADGGSPPASEDGGSATE